MQIRIFYSKEKGKQDTNSACCRFCFALITNHTPCSAPLTTNHTPCSAPPSTKGKLDQACKFRGKITSFPLPVTQKPIDSPSSLLPLPQVWSHSWYWRSCGSPLESSPWSCPPRSGMSNPTVPLYSDNLLPDADNRREVRHHREYYQLVIITKEIITKKTSSTKA